MFKSKALSVAATAISKDNLLISDNLGYNEPLSISPYSTKFSRVLLLLKKDHQRFFFNSRCPKPIPGKT